MKAMRHGLSEKEMELVKFLMADCPQVIIKTNRKTPQESGFYGLSLFFFRDFEQKRGPEKEGWKTGGNINDKNR